MSFVRMSRLAWVNGLLSGREPSPRAAWRLRLPTISVSALIIVGDHLPSDYVTHIEEGGFYGWPWYYIGAHQDPHHQGKHPELKDKVIVPDVLLQAHSASLGMAIYTGEQFPAEYRQVAFAAEHGSWNRAQRTGYKVISVPLRESKATGEYVDFMTGFVAPEGNVWGVR